MADAGREVLVREAQILVTSKPDEELINGLSWRKWASGFPPADARGSRRAVQPLTMTVRFLSRAAPRRIRIGGSFKANNLEVFVQLLHEGFGTFGQRSGDRGSSFLAKKVSSSAGHIRRWNAQGIVKRYTGTLKVFFWGIVLLFACVHARAGRRTARRRSPFQLRS